MTHVRSLDGARGAAVLMVILFHSGLPGMSLGWAGVPLFFCLSGFLITRILLEQRGEPFGAYLKRFLINRSLRIFPLFYLYLAVNYALLVATGRPATGYAWFVTYLQNYYIGVHHATPGILGHTWSLAVEEQFYWVWPLVIFVLAPRRMPVVFGALVVASALSRLAIYRYTGGDAFMTNVTLASCVDMLVLGALFARLRDHARAPALAAGLFAGGAVLTAWAIAQSGLDAFWQAENWAGRHWYLFTALGMMFSALIFFLYRWETDGKHNLLLAAARNGFMRYTGKISYGLYMWHLLCFTVVERVAPRLSLDGDGVAAKVAAVALSYAVSAASYRFFEERFLRLKRHQPATAAG